MLLNVGEARAVVLLWNGRQRKSFAGHLDTARPLVANPDLVALPPAEKGRGGRLAAQVDPPGAG